MRRRTFLASFGLTGLSGCLRLQGNEPTATQGSGQPDSPTASASPLADSTPTSSETPERSPTESETETEEPTESATETPSVDYPLGLTPEGPEPILADAHRNELVDGSFEVRYKLEDVGHGGISENYTQRASDDYRVEINHGRQNDLIRFTTAPEDMWWRQLVDGERTFGYNHWAQSKAGLSHSEELKTFLDGGEFGPPEVHETDAGPAFTITADAVEDGTVFSSLPYVEPGTVETLEATARVSAEGIITEFTAEFQWIPDNREELLKQRVSFSIEARGITISEPDWLATAKEQAPSATVDLTDDRLYVAVSHDGGNPMVAGSQFAFRAPPESDEEGLVHAKQIDTDFEAGQTAYVYIEDGEMAVNIGGRPEGASPTELTADYRAFAEVGSAPYFPPTSIQ